MGCQMNKSDTERMFGMLSNFGYEETETPKEADLLMVNTCSIRQLSEDKAFSLIGTWGKWKKTRPELKIGFCGCVAQQKAEEIFKRAHYVDFVLGTHKIYSLPDIIKKINNGEKVCECEETNATEDDKAVKLKLTELNLSMRGFQSLRAVIIFVHIVLFLIQEGVNVQGFRKLF